MIPPRAGEEAPGAGGADREGAVRLPYTVDKPKPYQPSNGTEAMFFMAEFCDKCKREPVWGA